MDAILMSTVVLCCVAQTHVTSVAKCPLAVFAKTAKLFLRYHASPSSGDAYITIDGLLLILSFEMIFFCVPLVRPYPEKSP